MAATAAVALTLAAGCGGGTRQDAGERAATYPVAIARASFPAHQDLAERTAMRIAVTNTGTRTIPNVAATIEAAGRGTTVEAFGLHSEEADVQTSSRPAWIVDVGPIGGETASPNTWALGRLAPHATKTFAWDVVAVQPGSYRLVWRLAGSLTGRSQLRVAGGGAPHGSFAVTIGHRAAQVRVTPGGRIVRVPGR
jgi:hypothetical protein